MAREVICWSYVWFTCCFILQACNESHFISHVKSKVIWFYILILLQILFILGKYPPIFLKNHSFWQYLHGYMWWCMISCDEICLIFLIVGKLVWLYKYKRSIKTMIRKNVLETCCLHFFLPGINTITIFIIDCNVLVSNYGLICRLIGWKLYHERSIRLI